MTRYYKSISLAEKTAYALVALVSLMCSAVMAYPDPYYVQDFDSWPEQTIWGEHTYDGWLVSNGVIRSYSGFGWPNNPHSGTQEAGLNGNASSERSSVTTPLMTNGAGKVSCYYAFSQLGVATFEIQSSTNGGTTWSTHASITDTNVDDSAYRYYETHLDIYENTTVRIEKTDDDSSTLYLLIDDFTVNLPPAYAVISDVQSTPTPKLTDTSVEIRAKIVPQVYGSNIEPVVYYSTNNWDTMASTPMTETGNSYYVTSPDIPRMDKPGLTVDYYIDVKLDGPTTNNTHSYWPEGAPTTTQSYLLRARPFSTSYGSMTVTNGPPTTSMLLQSDYVWRGITEKGTFTNPSFNFQSGATSWGDTNQTGTILPLSGVAVTSGTIDLTETVSNHLEFTFNETATNSQYGIQPCEYVYFDDWSSATTFSSYTNAEQWSMYNSRTTDSGETNKAFTGAGKSAVLQGASNGWIRTPYLPSGLGALNFRMRNWMDDGSVPVKLSVEKSSDGSSWLPVTSYSSILTPDYIFISLNIADDANHYVRIVNASSNATDYLCLDNVSVTPPGALVNLSNPTIDPSSPDSSPLPVTVTIDYAVSGDATNLQGRIYWLAPDSVDYDWAEMSATGTTFYGQIPPTLAGTVYYYFECTYDGFNAAPAEYPNGGASAPMSFVASSNAPVYRVQDFDSWPEQTIWGEHTYDGWLVSNGVIRAYSGFGWPNNPNSGTQEAGLNGDAATERSSVVSPVLTNGVGNVSFYYAFSQLGVASFELQSSTDNGASWTIHASVTDTNVDDLAYKFFSYNVDVDENALVRIEKTADDSSTLYLLIDDVICAPPSADVIITNVYLSPGYPGTADTVTVSCDIYPANALFRPFDFRPKLCYRPPNGSWTTNDMTQYASDSWQATIPPQPPDTVEYFFRCDFAGYYYTNGAISMNRSPAFLPDAPSTTNQPDTYFEYLPRRFLSQYSSISVSSSVDSVEMSLIGDNNWQGVFDSPTNSQLTLNFLAEGYFSGSGIESTTNSFGDDGQIFTDPPFSGNASEGGSNIVVNIDTSSLSQVVFFFNPNSGYYEIRRGAYEDFDDWLADPNYFANSLNLADINILTNQFNDWPLNFDYVTVTNRDLENFQTILDDTYYDYFSGSVGPSNWTINGYYIEDGKIARGVGVDTANNSFQSTSPGLGATGPQESTIPDGVGWIEWKARARHEDNYYTWYTNGLNWTNYEVTATIYGRDGAGWPKLSLYAYYQNPSNYYECLVQGTNYSGGTPRFHLGVYRMKNGERSRRWSTTVNNRSFSNTMDVTFRVSTENNRVRLSARTSVGGNHNGWSDSDGLRLTGGGSIGLRTDDVKMVADDIRISSWYWNTFDGIDPNKNTYTPSTNRFGWYFENCSLEDHDIYMTNNIQAYLQSPQIHNVPTEIQIRQRYYMDEGPALTSTYTVQGSVDGSSGWTDIQTFVTSNNYERTDTISSGFSSYRYLRIKNDDAPGNPGRIRFRWVFIDGNTTFYTEDFSDGIADDWRDDSGYWTVTNQTYERRAYCGPEIGFELQTKYSPSENEYPTWGPGDTYASYVLPSNNQYKTYREYFKFWDDHLFYRVRHTSGNAHIRFDDMTMSSWRAEDYEASSNGWATTEGWVTETSPGERQVELWRSRANPTNAQTVRSAKMTNGVGVIQFDYDFEGMNGSNAVFTVEYDYITNGPFTTTLDTRTVTPTDTLPGKYYLNISTSEQWFVRVRHITSNDTAIMKMDNFKISDYKPRDERTWEAYNAKITSLEDIREFEPAYEPEGDVRTAYLNLSATSNTLNGAIYSNSYPYIQSGKIKEGIGRVSFWYRSWETDGNPPGKIRIFASPTETAPMTNWTELASFNVENTYYKLYQNDFYRKNDYYLRVTSDTNGAGRVAIDNMLVAQPLAADFDVSLISISPSIPLSTDTVDVSADINRFVLSPSNIQAKLYYQIGTNDWGNLSNTWGTAAIDMSNTWSSSTGMSFATDSPIPAQGIDTVVQYYVEFNFDGVFASKTSPKKGRTFTNPSWYSNINLNVDAPITNPYYIVYSCPPDEVWINEFNYPTAYGDGANNEFVELAGQSGSHVYNWRVDLVKEDGTSIYGSYPITNILNIPDDTGSGFGFWLLGDAGLTGIDATYTNTAKGSYHMWDPKGGIRLVRASGIWEHFVSYGTTPMPGAELAGSDGGVFQDGTMRLIGTGETVNAFSWDYQDAKTATLNAANYDQTLEYAVPPPPTYSIVISNFWTTSSNTWVVSVSDHSNRIEITPWYCTNLVNTNWLTVPGIVSETYTPSGIYTQWFDNVTNPPPVYFRVNSTNDP